MTTPAYRDIQSDAIPELRLPSGVLVRVIAGSSHGLAGSVQRDTTEPLYLDVHFDSGGEFRQTLPADMNAFVYVYRGAAEIDGQAIPAQRMAILANDGHTDGVVIRSQRAARVLLIAGRPLGEPIAQHGPFVMNTHQELMQAVEDFQAGKFHRPDAPS